MISKNLVHTAKNIRIIGNLKFFYRTGTCDEIILSEAYQNSRFFVPEYIPKEDHIILDIGAHIGIFSLMAADKVSNGKVYAVEADEQNYCYLKANIELNVKSNVSTHLFALTDYRGTGKLFSASENWGHSLTVSASESWTAVTTDTLTNFMIDNDIGHVDYMKMNVEGAEYTILLGSPERTLKKIKCMLVEFHPSNEKSERDLTHYLKQCGFSIRIKHSDIERGKGWIVARLGPSN